MFVVLITLTILPIIIINITLLLFIISPSLLYIMKKMKGQYQTIQQQT